MTCFLGIDVSTTGAKALIIDEQGCVAAEHFSAYPVSTPRPLWSEQDPVDWWSGTCACIRAALGKARLPAAAIGAVGLTGQMHGLVLLDRSDHILRPAILWNDQRTASQCEELTAKVGGHDRLLELTGNRLLPGFTAPKIAWVRENEPRVYGKAAHVLLPKDYVRLRLTGEHATEVSDASGTALLDVKRRSWSKEMLEALGIPEAWLPACSESDRVSGRISASAASATGLKAGTPVVGGGGDQAAQAVGSGVVMPGLVLVTTGTSGVVFAPGDRYAAEAQGRLHAFCHAVPGTWHVMGVMLSAGGSLRWLRDAIGSGGKTAVPYEQLTQEAGAAPAGSEGLVFLPYLAGERTPHPDPRARGAFIGLTLRHGRAHLVRSVLEGVAFGLRDSLELIKGLGLPIRQVRASGGGARSAAWRQIQADVFGVELVLVNATEGAAFGAALLAAVGAGMYRSVAEAVQAMVRVTGRTEPIAANVSAYEESYAVYRGLYPALKDTFHAL